MVKAIIGFGDVNKNLVERLACALCIVHVAFVVWLQCWQWIIVIWGGIHACPFGKQCLSLILFVNDCGDEFPYAFKQTYTADFARFDLGNEYKNVAVQ